MGDSVLTNVEGPIATITLNRPKVLNALNAELADNLFHELARLENKKNVRCLIIQGNGGHFMAGGDLKSFKDELVKESDDRKRYFELFVGKVHPIIQSMRRMPKPIIASVNGAAGGFGMSLMMACDLVIAAEDTVFTMAYSNIGTSPDGSSTWFLPRIVGLRKAMELALLAERFDANTAQNLGLINRNVNSDLLNEHVNNLAQQLANGPTQAYANTKFLLNRSLESGLDSQLQAEAECFAECASTDDFKEGILSFVEKRKAKFIGK